MAIYTVYRAPGWHSDPTDPVILTTDDRRKAALRAGMRVDISMPGGCNRYDAYATDGEGEEIERIESFRCDKCDTIVAWGECGPVGTMDGEILDCPASVEKHLVTWICDECADQILEDAVA